MIKTRNLLYLLILIFLCSCSFDNKTGIWSGGKKEKQRIAELEKEQRQIIDTVKIYSPFCSKSVVSGICVMKKTKFNKIMKFFSIYRNVSSKLTAKSSKQYRTQTALKCLRILMENPIHHYLC